LLEEFGYQWSKELDAWTNRDGGRALSFETVSRWTLDELRGWLAQGAK